MIKFREFVILESRGLTHDANLGKSFADSESPGKDVYEYSGFQFFEDVDPHLKGLNILRKIGNVQKSGAIFKFLKNEKASYVVYYSKSVTPSSAISPSKLGFQHSGRKGATENLGITASTLIKKGNIVEKIFNNIPVKCMAFTSKSHLIESILFGLKSNRNVSQELYDSVDNYFKGDMQKFDWLGVQQSEINEVGKYLGELLIGVIAMSGIRNLFSSDIFEHNQIKDFFVPDDPSFSGFDSAFTLSDGSVIPISSKLGVGAKASIFTNFMPKIMDHPIPMNSIVGRMKKSALSVGITKNELERKKGSKNITYEFGIREILKISKNQIPDTYSIFMEAKKNPKFENYSKELRLVVDEIMKHPHIDKKVKDLLPMSITSAFSREIARLLNQDHDSYELFVKILAAKKFYQANLDLAKWKRGEVFFKLLPSGEAKLSFIGSKAAINDIDAKQGLVNYELKY